MTPATSDVSCACLFIFLLFFAQPDKLEHVGGGGDVIDVVLSMQNARCACALRTRWLYTCFYT